MSFPWFRFLRRCVVGVSAETTVGTGSYDPGDHELAHWADGAPNEPNLAAPSPMFRSSFPSGCWGTGAGQAFREHIKNLGKRIMKSVASGNSRNPRHVVRLKDRDEIIEVFNDRGIKAEVGEAYSKTWTATNIKLPGGIMDRLFWDSFRRAWRCDVLGTKQGVIRTWGDLDHVARLIGADLPADAKFTHARLHCRVAVFNDKLEHLRWLVDGAVRAAKGCEIDPEDGSQVSDMFDIGMLAEEVAGLCDLLVEQTRRTDEDGGAA